jgi:NAD(P)-dependent dehydrogenase (short-subunit alcohol dehydrogenase family)
MAPRTWLITGVRSGFGRELTQQLLDRGDRVAGTVRIPPRSPTCSSGTRRRSAPRCWT